VIVLAARIVATVLRGTARLLDPAGADNLNVHIDAGNPVQVDQLEQLVTEWTRRAWR